MKKKRVIIGISVAAVLAVCAVVLGVVFGVRAKKPTHEHDFDYTSVSWEWKGDERAQASVQCACGETLILQTEIAQKTILPATCEDAGRALFTAKFTANGTEYSDEKQVDLPALGHDFDYTAILWNWDEDAPTATANVPCKRGEHTLNLTPEVDEEILLEPACESEGSALYTARLISGEQEYTDTSLRKLTALGHDYNFEYKWESDLTAATLYLSCKRECGKTHTERVESTFSHKDPTCELSGSDTYIVKTTYDGKVFDEAYVKSISALGHDFDYTTVVEWLWHEREAKAVVRCKRDSKHSLQFETEIEEEVLRQPTCEEEGEGRYTAVFQRGENRFTDEKKLPIPAVGHDYDFAAAVWEWDGTQSASATVPCTRNSAHTQMIPAEITVYISEEVTCTQAGAAEYTATVTDANGQEYTNTIRTQTLGGHAYGKAEFWNNDMHELVCTNCGHQGYEAHENDGNKICTLCGVSTWLYYGNEGLTVTVSAYPNEVTGYDSSITKIVIPNRYYYDGLTATVYEVYNFQYCNGLESVIISDGVKQISANAFSGCSSLKEVIVPSEFMHIGTHAFSGCSALTEFVYPNLTLIMDYTFINCIALTKVTLPEGLQSISEGAFQGCTALAELNLPSTVTRIDEKAFFNCRALSLDNLPSRLQSIGGSAFYYCQSLTEITIPSSVTAIGDSAFSGCSGVKNITFNGVLEKIGLFTFNNCASLTDIKLPYGLKEIGYGSFSGCSSLAKINLPSSLQSIGQQAFDCCTSLAQINLPSGLQSIGQQAFRECTSLKEIMIPRSVETMGNYVFQSTETITIICEATSKPSRWSENWNASQPVYWAHEYVIDDAIGVRIDD